MNALKIDFLVHVMSKLYGQYQIILSTHKMKK